MTATTNAPPLATPTRAGLMSPGDKVALASAATLADGCCRLSVVSTTVLKLSPYKGTALNVGGVICAVPAAGVTISNAGLAASTIYYVYATATGNVVTGLSISATSHVTGPDGREYLSAGGVPVLTARLVGMIYTDGSGSFVDSLALRGCLNWFFRRSRKVYVTANSIQTASQSFTPIGTPGYIPVWGDESLNVRVSGWASINAAGYAIVAGPVIDGASAGYAPIIDEQAANGRAPFASEIVVQPIAEGPHSVGLGAYVTGQTGTFFGATIAETMG